MSDQWVDQQGFLRNSSGRYQTGRSPASIAIEKDDFLFNSAKGFEFISSPQNAWANSVRPKLAAILVNEKMKVDDGHVFIGIEIEHAKQLRDQLDRAIWAFNGLHEQMVKQPEETRKMLCDNAGITIT